MTPRKADLDLPLSPPVFHILLALGEDVLHGYGIMQRFEELTGGDQLLPGTLYATLARMVEGGLIREAPAPRGDRSEGAPRRHYRVTAKGRNTAAAESLRMRRLIDVARERDWLPETAG
jgi:DNA-binding PadR family transcriptional regulator